MLLKTSPRLIWKFLLGLGVWSFVVIGLFKLHTNNVILNDEDAMSSVNSGRLLLQKDFRFAEATSTTTEKFMPVDVLIDNRTSEYYSYICNLTV